VKGRAFDIFTAQVEVKDASRLPKAKVVATTSPPASPLHKAKRDDSTASGTDDGDSETESETTPTPDGMNELD